MPTKQRSADIGTRLGVKAMAELGRAIFEGRLAASLSQAELGAAAAMSRSAVARYESGRYRGARLIEAARLLRVLGLELRVTAYPVGNPLRDAGHLRVIQRVIDLVGLPLRYATDVPLPNPGDARAWDIVLSRDRARVALEVETRLRDLQELIRRLHAKRRDGMVDGLVLVLANTRHNRSLLPMLESLLPDYPRLGRARFAALLRGGKLPADCIVLL